MSTDWDGEREPRYMAPTTVFLSYSHHDEKWKEALSIQLRALQAGDEDFVDPWDDRRIGVGENWRKEIEDAMDRASVAVLLISAHFLVSTFILREEVPRLLERRGKGLTIVPILVSPVNWQRVDWLASIALRPNDGRPISLGNEAQIDADYAAIAGQIAEIIDRVREKTPQPVASIAEVTVPAETTAPSDIAKEAKTADAAVRAVVNLASTTDMPERLQSFRRDLQVASHAILRITTYKELHDELHTFEEESFADILNEHERVATDARARESLESRAMTLLGTIESSRALVARLPLSLAGMPPAPDPNREIAWIERLEQAHQLLIESIATREIERSKAAVALIIRVLDRELGRLNEVIVGQAAQLEVSVAPVKNALVFAHDHAVALKIEFEREDKIQRGIDAFERLISGFMVLIKEHNLWQGIEDELRIVDTSLASSLTQLDLLWPALQEKIKPTLAVKGGAWAAKLQARFTALQNILVKRAPEQSMLIRELFTRFRRACAQHFLFIDTKLREECGKLADVDESLQLLIRIIDTQGAS